jgi:selenocysteine lyase/cysteine desulfurase
MTLSNPKQYYTRFLKGHEGKLHFAAHSHHFWPDVSREGHMAYWDDCALASDEKWNKIFSETIPKTQKHIARMLNLKHHEQIALAPNTHELSTRLLSLFLGKSELKILTTTNEFNSWRRQFLRLSELPQVKIHQIDSNDFLNQRESVISNLKTELAKNYDLIFLSQVFFDSGCALTDAEVQSLLAATPDSTLFVLDGYHGFGAIPCDLSAMEGRLFYLGGGYKYAQAGEGVGFMVVPKGDWRPANTGWFAEYAQLTKATGKLVGYAPDAMAFMGATQDPSGFYRFNAIWDHFEANGIDIQSIHQYVLALQKSFIAQLPLSFLKTWSLKALFEENLSWHGHFLTFEASTLEVAQKCQKELSVNNILIDRRGTRLRFGFGLYQSETDVKELTERLKNLA